MWAMPAMMAPANMPYPDFEVAEAERAANAQFSLNSRRRPRNRPEGASCASSNRKSDVGAEFPYTGRLLIPNHTYAACSELCADGR